MCQVSFVKTIVWAFKVMFLVLPYRSVNIILFSKSSVITLIGTSKNDIKKSPVSKKNNELRVIANDWHVDWCIYLNMWPAPHFGLETANI